MMHFVTTISDQEESAELVKVSEPAEAKLGIRLSPLFEKSCLVEAGQHQVLTGHRPPVLALQQIWDEA